MRWIAWRTSLHLGGPKRAKYLVCGGGERNGRVQRIELDNGANVQGKSIGLAEVVKETNGISSANS